MYQFLYIPVSWLPRKRRAREVPLHRFAVLIAACNEETVIGNLLDSIKAQSYPERFLEVFVVADNCRDKTAETARAHGAEVYERHNASLRGKGYALDYGFSVIRSQYADKGYEAYFVFDADNVLDVNYFREMNKTFDNGAKASTSYRNSKNYDSNWISAGYAVWFLREAKFLNQARLTLNTSCAISGTGFFIAADVIEKAGGWKWHLLTEDIEFSASSILQGVRIAYTPTAILYDEQPVTFSQSWRQRLRWSKGFLQVFRYYGSALLKRAVRERDFSCIDFTLMLCPFTVLGAIRAVMGLLFAACGFVSWPSQLQSLADWSSGIITSVLGLMALAALTIIVEHDQIGATNKELLAYVLSFPIYILSYVPISFQAIFAKAQWKPIAHKG